MQINLSPLLAYPLAFLIFILLAAKFTMPGKDSREPPYIQPKVPWVGHIIGLLWRKYQYYVDLSIKYNLPIYALAILGMPGGRVYIINSPDLAIAIQHEAKKLSFWTVEAVFSAGMAGLSRSATKAIKNNVNGEKDEPSLLYDAMIKLHNNLKPGEELDSLSRAGMQKIAASIQRLDSPGSTKIDLWQWMNAEMMLAITDSFFGPKNPFNDPIVVNAFLDFEDNAVGLLSFPMPSITCVKAYAGREKLVAAFENYYKANGPDTASHSIQQLSGLADAHHLSLNDKARFAAIQVHAFIANTNPTAFWTMFHMLSDRSVLEEVRSAVLPLLTVKNENGTLIGDIDVSKIRDIPILKSIIHESLRHHASGTGTRIVLEDTLLDEHYLLKKGSFVFMPNRSYHFSSTWGPKVNEFDARHFIASSKKRSHHPSAFRGFGGGVNLCPGRFLAMNDILAMCAMFALRFDVKPVGGSWNNPGDDHSNMSLIVSPPKKRLLVDVTAREEYGQWSFKF